MYDCVVCWRPQNGISISFSFFLLPRHESSTRVPPGFTMRPAAKCVNDVYTVELHLLVIGIAKYPDRLGPSGKHFRTAIVLHLFMASVFAHLSNTYKELCINILFVRK